MRAGSGTGSGRRGAARGLALCAATLLTGALAGCALLPFPGTTSTTPLPSYTGAPASAASPTGSADATTGASAAASPSVEPADASSPAPPTGTATLPDGSLRITDAVAGFQVTIPRGYTRITNQKQLDAVIKEGAKAMKSSSSAQLAAQAFSQNVKVFAINKLTGSSISLAATDSFGSTAEDLPDLQQVIKTSLTQQMHAKSMTMTTITVDGAPALRADGSVSATGRTLRFTEVFTIHGSQMFIIAISGLATPSEKTVGALLSSAHFYD